jgi:hypothetical protein
MLIHLSAKFIMEATRKDNGLQLAIRQKHAGGAPRKKVKRERSIRVRLTATEHYFIQGKAKTAGMRISDWFRSAAKSGKITPRLNAEDRSILHMLAGMANNLNQLAKAANTSGILTIARKCGELLVEIEKTIKYLYQNDQQDR